MKLKNETTKRIYDIINDDINRVRQLSYNIFFLYERGFPFFSDSLTILHNESCCPLGFHLRPWFSVGILGDWIPSHTVPKIF